MRRDDEAAAESLAELSKFFRSHPVTGPAGHSYIASEARPTRVHAGAPANLTVVDHIDATVAELADYTRQANPEAGTLPPRVEAVYEWCAENTKNAPQDVQQRRDTIVYRQHLEHAIAMGDTKVVRPIRCPACRTLGLFWKREISRAICTNARCLTKDGLSHRWTLARLAHAQIEDRQKSVRVRAT
ncbi:hypothetical protein ACIP2X_38240 [Streptomyces sp. NPDC089424]|uniref:hypothetical protein n=1 Tax=Streptomyces sp. NPDC089424 TaxID=3365917 RepID=UPI0038235D48